MKRSGPSVFDYLNSKGNRLKLGMPMDFYGTDDVAEPASYAIQREIERCKVQIDQENIDPVRRDLLTTRLRLAEASLLAHILAR